MSHPFFRTINWDKLYRKEYVPPYNPNVSGELDLHNFDREVTQERIEEDTSSPSRTSEVSVSVANDMFAGFSYIPPPPEEMSLLMILCLCF